MTIRMGGSGEREDKFRISVRHGAQRIALFEASSGFAEPRGKRRVFQHLSDRARESVDIAHIDEKRAGLALHAEDVSEHGKVVGDDRQPSLRGLDGREAKGLGAAWEDEAIQRGEENTNPLSRDLADKMQSLADAGVAARFSSRS